VCRDREPIAPAQNSVSAENSAKRRRTLAERPRVFPPFSEIHLAKSGTLNEALKAVESSGARVIGALLETRGSSYASISMPQGER